MATTDDYLYAIEVCRCHVESTQDDEVKRMWLLIAESYQLLLIVDKIQAAGALITPPTA